MPVLTARALPQMPVLTARALPEMPALTARALPEMPALKARAFWHVARGSAAAAAPPITSKEVLRQAEAEGLTLLRSERGSTGYKGVRFNSSSKRNPYVAKVSRGGKETSLGCFATPEEAALCYARTPEGQAAAARAAAAPPVPQPLTAEEALRQAEAEGLTLLRSEFFSTGYRGVSFNSGSKRNPYVARVYRGGKQVHLGQFTTPEEAALCYARTPDWQAAAAAPPVPQPLTAKEALRQAEAEGLTLLRSEGFSTGYKGVSFNSGSKRNPYVAKVSRGGKETSLGCFATVEEVALCSARTPAGQAAAAAPPVPQPPTAKEALRQAEMEGLTLLRSERGSTGYTGVSFKGFRNRAKPYHAEVKRGGRTIHLGCFATAEEAALCYLRTPEGQAAAAAPPVPQPLTAEEALRQAEAEGLTLLRSERGSTRATRMCSSTSAARDIPTWRRCRVVARRRPWAASLRSRRRRCAMRGHQRGKRLPQRRQCHNR